jgi:hypothetical protein
MAHFPKRWGSALFRHSPSGYFASSIRADRIGYAAFETPGQLLDYGTSRFNTGEPGRARVEFLLRALAPTVPVLKRPRTLSTRKRPRGNMNRAMVEREAKRLHVPLAFVADRAEKKLLAGFDCRNKFQVAALLGVWFPEIARHVPQARKCYEPEPWTIAYFEAIALGVAYFMLMADTAPGTAALSSASK